MSISKRTGMIVSQVADEVLSKCFKNLHLSANLNGINDILEISSKSDEPLGNDLSAFNLSYIFKGEYFPVRFLVHCEQRDNRQ